jgi:hypothetical protein
MEDNFDNIERIIDYLNGNMTPPQYTAFETLISNDEALAAQVDEMRVLMGGIEKYGDDKVKMQIKAVDKNLETANFFEEDTKTIIQPKFSFIKNNTFRWLMAASALGIALMTWYIFQAPKPREIIVTTPGTIEKPDNPAIPQVIDTIPNKIEKEKDNAHDVAVVDDSKYTDLLASTYQIPSFAKMRSDVDTVTDLVYLDSVKTLMQRKEFKKAQNLLKNHRFSSNYQNDALTLQGHISMQLKQYKQAESLFKQSVALGELPYSEDNEYYLLLAYLSDYKHYSKQFDVLSKKILADKGHSQYEKVVELLRKMRK